MNLMWLGPLASIGGIAFCLVVPRVILGCLEGGVCDVCEGCDRRCCLRRAKAVLGKPFALLKGIMHGLKVAMAWLCAPCWKGRRVPSDSLPLTSYHPSPPQSSGVNSRPPVPVGGVELGGRAIQNPILQARLEPVQAPPKRRPPPAASGKVPMGQPVPIGGGKPWGDLGCTSSEGISGVKLGGVSGYEGGWGATALPAFRTDWGHGGAAEAAPDLPQTTPNPLSYGCADGQVAWWMHHEQQRKRRWWWSSERGARGSRGGDTHGPARGFGAAAVQRADQSAQQYEDRLRGVHGRRGDARLGSMWA